MDEAKHLRFLRIRMAFSLIGAFVGISVLFSFLGLDATQAGIWGFISGIYAIIVFLLTWYQYRKFIRRHEPEQRFKPSNFQKLLMLSLTIIGIIGSAAGFSGMIFYLIIGGINHEPCDTTSSWVVSVWTFMTLKWAFVLTYVAWKQYLKNNFLLSQTSINL
eukprot:TRINITY_DN709_c2_g2_i1.p1 TRINITY_DN709_c2_g2~~TRINITY_DN709_c2_g2_i1.p1  ORF type:complete len:180 (-),score=57.85 TRINITY_DN709_c2_g2_i1:400-882(-)